MITASCRVAAIASGLLSAAGGLRPQLSLHAALGARYSSALVHDSIVAPFDLRPAMAPPFAITATSRTAARLAAQATFAFATGSPQRHDAGRTPDQRRADRR